MQTQSSNKQPVGEFRTGKTTITAAAKSPKTGKSIGQWRTDTSWEEEQSRPKQTATAAPKPAPASKPAQQPKKAESTPSRKFMAKAETKPPFRFEDEMIAMAKHMKAHDKIYIW